MVIHKLSYYKPLAFTFPDQLNLFQGSQELNSTARSDYGSYGRFQVQRKSLPKDCLSFSLDKLESSTTLKDAYMPYSSNSYNQEGAGKAKTNGSISRRSIVNRYDTYQPKQRQVGKRTSYSHHFAEKSTEKCQPFRPTTEQDGPSGDRSFSKTNDDYKKNVYGRPVLSKMYDCGVFDKKSHNSGTTNLHHFSVKAPTKRHSLRPKTTVLLGTESATPETSYHNQFSGITQVYAA